MTLEQVTRNLAVILDYPTLGYDEDIFKFGLVDSLALVEIAVTFNLDLEQYTQERWATPRKIHEEMRHEVA